MKLCEIAKLQRAKRWKRFVYLTENQPLFDKTYHPVKMSLTFDKLTVTTGVGVGGLFFRRGENYILIDAIKRISCKPCILGDILTVECVDGTSYILIAQE